jgi:serine/threonine protein kinase
MTDRPETTAPKTAPMRQDALAPGTTLLGGQYCIERYLASGGFGITYLATDSLERTVVIKECYPEALCGRAGTEVHVRTPDALDNFQTVVRHFEREARRLAKLSHPSIVGVHQVFADNGTAYMALDYVDGYDLMSIIKDHRVQMPPEAIKAMLVRLLQAVGYLHDNNMLHRDISPDNILVDAEGRPVLIDFGAAYEVSATTSRAVSALHVVKDGYSPQESYLQDLAQTMASDLYALAATFYHLITGAAPPNSQIRVAALASNRPDPYKPIPVFESGFDRYFLGAIDRALAVFPEDRLQNAGEWLDLIEEERRCAALKAQAQRDQQVELDIRALTEETNRAIAETRPPEAVVPRPRRVSLPKRPAPAAQPSPPVEAAAKAPQPAAEELPDLREIRPASGRSLLGRILSKRGEVPKAGTPSGGGGA